MQRKLAFIWLMVFLCLSGCAVNPVTGKNELALVPEATEINIGNEQYLPSRQMQGGDYNVSPQVVTYVKGVGQRLAAVSDRDLPYEFNVINDSTPNAWALPGGKIVINRGLLVELESEAELAAVLGHEIVHAAARHGAKGMERGMLLQGAVMAAGIASQNSEFSQLAIGGAGIAAQLITQRYSRDAETEADFYGMKYMSKAGYDPRAAIKLQETFVRLSAGGDANWLSGLFASHPPSQERVDANRITAANLPQGGEIGRDRYQQALAPLLRDSDAYQAYDAGRKALSEDNYERALNLANKALQLQPREALFHSLRGDVRLKQHQYRDAITNYDRAVQYNREYFHYYLQRGLAHLQLHEKAQGEADLKKSITLLPTAPAMNALGELSLASGDIVTAKNYFSAAASSNSTAGKAAAQAFVRLDLPDNPDKYLQLRLGRDRSNYLLVQVSNGTEQSVSHIGFVVQFTDVQGQVRNVRMEIPGRLGSQQAKTVSTGIGPFTSLDKVRGQVVRARVVE
ncbi:Putative Zn-dependent protease, contains TPR repeats [Desulfuromusa kysingii]|uniref:Putative Zn-dependent protease, contains TPR repeats n=1 Tax=Desulfuromusa kysingii TaxID=37625 RepID=A0A1H3XF81_9BACT|nr:M48 family metalloprotease [Desulfuromusa kysingii]SDZ97880.1 Putative Zn-dependent protease, contains TPR repeats [Desulfuromusa kysingii]